MNELPLYENGKKTGKICWRREGLYCRFEAVSELRGEGIRRAYLCGETKDILLGVMEPQGGKLCCRKSFALQQLRSLGTWQRGEIRGGPDAEWKNYCGGLKGEFSQRIGSGALIRQNGDRTYLALPYDAAKPFPLPEVFCLASICSLRGQKYVVYAFSSDGCLLPQE